MLATTVHTTGVNLDGVLANVASITVIMGAFGALLLRAFRRSIKDEIQSVIEAEVIPKLDSITEQLQEHVSHLAVHDSQLAHLEGIEEGKRMAATMANMTTNDAKPRGTRKATG